MNLLLKNYRHFTAFAGIVLLGVLFFVVVSAGYYPIGMVNQKLILSRQFRKDYRASSSYYLNVLKTYRSEDPDSEKSAVTSLEVQLSVLNQMVENVLVSQAARKELGEDFDGFLENKIGRYEHDVEFRKAAETIYGLSFTDFKKEILIPRAERDLLSGHLFLRGDSLERWLRDAKRASAVRIFSGKFYWDGEEVKAAQGKSAL